MVGQGDLEAQHESQATSGRQDDVFQSNEMFDWNACDMEPSTSAGSEHQHERGDGFLLDDNCRQLPSCSTSFIITADDDERWKSAGDESRRIVQLSLDASVKLLQTAGCSGEVMAATNARLSLNDLFGHAEDDEPARTERPPSSCGMCSSEFLDQWKCQIGLEDVQTRKQSQDVDGNCSTSNSDVVELDMEELVENFELLDDALWIIGDIEPTHYCKLYTAEDAFDDAELDVSSLRRRRFKANTVNKCDDFVDIFGYKKLMREVLRTHSSDNMADEGVVYETLLRMVEDNEGLSYKVDLSRLDPPTSLLSASNSSAAETVHSQSSQSTCGYQTSVGSSPREATSSTANFLANAGSTPAHRRTTSVGSSTCGDVDIGLLDFSDTELSLDGSAPSSRASGEIALLGSALMPITLSDSETEEVATTPHKRLTYNSSYMNDGQIKGNASTSSQSSREKTEKARNNEHGLPGRESKILLKIKFGDQVTKVWSRYDDDTTSLPAAKRQRLASPIRDPVAPSTADDGVDKENDKGRESCSVELGSENGEREKKKRKKKKKKVQADVVVATEGARVKETTPETASEGADDVDDEIRQEIERLERRKRKKEKKKMQTDIVVAAEGAREKETTREVSFERLERKKRKKELKEEQEKKQREDEILQKLKENFRAKTPVPFCEPQPMYKRIRAQTTLPGREPARMDTLDLDFSRQRQRRQSETGQQENDVVKVKQPTAANGGPPKRAKSTVVSARYDIIGKILGNKTTTSASNRFQAYRIPKRIDTAEAPSVKGSETSGQVEGPSCSTVVLQKAGPSTDGTSSASAMVAPLKASSDGEKKKKKKAVGVDIDQLLTINNHMVMMKKSVSNVATTSKEPDATSATTTTASDAAPTSATTKPIPAAKPPASTTLASVSNPPTSVTTTTLAATQTSVRIPIAKTTSVATPSTHATPALVAKATSVETPPVASAIIPSVTRQTSSSVIPSSSTSQAVSAATLTSVAKPTFSTSTLITKPSTLDSAVKPTTNSKPTAAATSILMAMLDSAPKPADSKPAQVATSTLTAATSSAAKPTAAFNPTAVATETSGTTTSPATVMKPASIATSSLAVTACSGTTLSSAPTPTTAYKPTHVATSTFAAATYSSAKPNAVSKPTTVATSTSGTTPPPATVTKPASIATSSSAVTASSGMTPSAGATSSLAAVTKPAPIFTNSSTATPASGATLTSAQKPTADYEPAQVATSTLVVATSSEATAPTTTTTSTLPSFLVATMASTAKPTDYKPAQVATSNSDTISTMIAATSLAAKPTADSEPTTVATSTSGTTPSSTDVTKPAPVSTSSSAAMVSSATTITSTPQPTSILTSLLVATRNSTAKPADYKLAQVATSNVSATQSLVEMLNSVVKPPSDVIQKVQPNWMPQLPNLTTDSDKAYDEDMSCFLDDLLLEVDRTTSRTESTPAVTSTPNGEEDEVPSDDINLLDEYESFDDASSSFTEPEFDYDLVEIPPPRAKRVDPIVAFNALFARLEYFNPPVKTFPDVGVTARMQLEANRARWQKFHNLPEFDPFELDLRDRGMMPEFQKESTEQLLRQFRYPFDSHLGNWWPLFTSSDAIDTEQMLKAPEIQTDRVFECLTNHTWRTRKYFLTEIDCESHKKRFIDAFAEFERFGYGFYKNRRVGSNADGRFRKRVGYCRMSSNQSREDGREKDRMARDEEFELLRSAENNLDDAKKDNNQQTIRECYSTVLTHHIRYHTIDRFSRKHERLGGEFAENPGQRDDPQPNKKLKVYENWLRTLDRHYVPVSDRFHAVLDGLNERNRKYDLLRPKRRFEFDQIDMDQLKDWILTPLLAGLFFQLRNEARCFSDAPVMETAEIRYKNYTKACSDVKPTLLRSTLDECRLRDFEYDYWTIIWEQICANYRILAPIGYLLQHDKQLMDVVDEVFEQIALVEQREHFSLMFNGNQEGPYSRNSTRRRRSPSTSTRRSVRSKSPSPRRRQRRSSSSSSSSSRSSTRARVNPHSNSPQMLPRY